MVGLAVARLTNAGSWLNNSNFKTVAIFLKLKITLKSYDSLCSSTLPFLIALSSFDMSPLQRDKCVSVLQGPNKKVWAMVINV